MLYLEWLITALIVLFPVTALTIKGGANKCLYLLVLVSLVCIAMRCKFMEQSFFQVLKKYWVMHLAMAGTVVAIVLNQFAADRFYASVYDLPSRLAFFALIMWVLLLLPLHHLKKIQWGMVAGAFAAAIKIHVVTTGASAPPTIEFINRIPYGDIALLLGVFSFLSIGWSERKDKWMICVKLAGGCAGLYTSYFSLARGGWIAVPVFVLVGFAFFDGLRLRRKLTALALMFALLGGVFSYSEVVQSRAKDARSDISQYLSGQNADTSIGIRFQLWRGSWVLFTEHPLTGVGREHFYPDAMRQLHERNIISAVAADFGHSHNELLFNLATLGVLGLISFVAIHVVPGYYFYQAARELDREIKTAGCMGVFLCLGYFMFGLTEAIFHTAVACAFFSIHAAVFFAFIVKRRKILGAQAK